MEPDKGSEMTTLVSKEEFRLQLQLAYNAGHKHGLATVQPTGFDVIEPMTFDEWFDYMYGPHDE